MLYDMIVSFLPTALAFGIWYFSPGFGPPIEHFSFVIFSASAVATLAMLAKSCESADAKARCVLLAFCSLWLFLLSAIWPYIALVNVTWNETKDEIQKGTLPLGVTAWSRAVDLYSFWVRTADFNLVSLAILLIAFALIIAFSNTARSSWRTLFPAKRLQAEGPWSAQFMSSTSTAALCRNATGLPLGTFGAQIIRYRPQPPVWPEGHHFIIAGTRGGKFVSAVAPAALDHLGSIVALDLKGEIFNACREERGKRRPQIALDPFGVLATPSARFDPLSYLRQDDVQRDIGTMADGMVKPADGEFAWIANGCVDIAKAAIESAILETPPESTNRFLKVVDSLLAADKLDTFEKWANQKNVADGRIADAAANLLDLSDRQRGSVLDDLRQNLVWARNPAIRDILNGNDFSFADIAEGRIDLYIVVPPDALREAAGLLRLIMNLALGAFLRGGVAIPAQNSLFIFDEFTRLGRMDKVIDIATIAAGFRVTALFVAQNLDSVQEVYGNSAMTLIGSCATTRVWGLGAGETTTAKWLSDCLGTATARTESKRSDEVSSGETAVPLMQISEILALPSDEQIIMFRGHAPARTKRIISHTHPYYRDRMPQRNE